MNILLLNDNPVVTKLVTLSAQKTGNEILTISNIEDIVDGSYDLLIVDEGLYTPMLFDELESKISYKRSLYMLSRGVASVDRFDNEMKKPFLPTDLVELLSTIAMSVANIQEKKKEPEIDGDDFKFEDDLDASEIESQSSKEDSSELDEFADFDFDTDDFDLNESNDETSSVLDQDDLNEVKNLLDETDEEELKLDDLEDNFSFDDLDLEDDRVEEKDEPEEDLSFDDLDFDDELIEEEKGLVNEEPDETSAEEEDIHLDKLMEEEFSLDELEGKIETAIATLSDEDLEQEIDFNLDELGELSTLDEKSLKIALGEELQEELQEEETFDELNEVDDVVMTQADQIESHIEDKDKTADGIEALKTLLKALSNEDVVASLKGMNVSINISFGNNSEK